MSRVSRAARTLTPSGVLRQGPRGLSAPESLHFQIRTAISQRPISTGPRLSKISWPIPTSQIVTTQNVKLRKGFNFRRVVVFAGIMYVCWSLYKVVVLVPLGRALQKSAEDLPDEDEEEDDPFFIPFPFTMKRVKMPPYTGADPEWQEFIRLSKDKAGMQKIHADMANLVRRVCEGNVWLAARVGKDMRVKKWWMDTDYPYFPPPEYHRSGILITDEDMQIATEVVDPATAAKINRILWPSPLVASSFAFTGALLKQTLVDAATLLGFKPNEISKVLDDPNAKPTQQFPPSHTPSIQKALETMRQQATKRPEEVQDPGALGSPKSQNSEHSESPSVAPPLPPKPPLGADKSPAGEPPKVTFHGHESIRSTVFGSPWEEFMKKLKQTWRVPPPVPPRGSVAISGLVELETSTAYIVIDVFGWYNPKTNSIEKQCVRMGLRRVQYKRQSPMGR